MATSGLYNFRLIHKDQHPARPNGQATNREDDTDVIELLASLHGVQPDRLRSVLSHGSMPASRGLSLRVAFSDLPNKLLRRERPAPSSVRRPT